MIKAVAPPIAGATSPADQIRPEKFTAQAHLKIGGSICSSCCPVQAASPFIGSICLAAAVVS